jgi:hypothetical protein
VRIIRLAKVKVKMWGNTMIEQEHWRPVVRFEECYEVSDQGRVRSIDRVVMKFNPKRGAIIPYRLRGKILALCRDRDGYLRAPLCKDGDERGAFVHTLVLEAFIGPRPTGLQACHWPDPSRDNNRLSNLRWGSSSSNQRDRFDHGTDSRGERNPSAKLIESEVRQILASEGTDSAVAARFGVSQQTVSSIRRGVSWPHLHPSRAWFTRSSRRLALGATGWRRSSTHLDGGT